MGKNIIRIPDVQKVLPGTEKRHIEFTAGQCKYTYGITKEMAKTIIDGLSEWVGECSNENSGLHLQRVSFSEAEVCDCTHTQGCKICGESKGLDGDFWKLLQT